MCEPGPGGLWGLRSATTRPDSTSTIWMLVSALFAVELWTSDASRCSSVAPTAVGNGAAATLRVVFFRGAARFFFFGAASAANATRRMRRMESRRLGRDVIEV